MTTFIRKALALTIAGGLLVAACGDNDDQDVSSDDTVENESSDDEATTVNITARDYTFDGVPATLSVGDKLALENSSDVEVHEIVALRIPDGEERSVEELVQLSEEELGEIFPQDAPPAALLIAPPGEEGFAALGDGTVSEPGRYALVCFIPLGADPEEYLDPANQTEEGPPDVEGGPPHFTEGMFAEITVE